MVSKLILPPDQSGYSIIDGDEILRQQLDGGMGRYRADILNASRLANCQWTLSPQNYNYFRAFYNSLHKSSEAFLVDLYLDYSELTEHEVRFIPGSMRLSSQRGLTFTVSCQLEVKPIDNTLFDNSFVMMVDTYGSIEDAIEILNLFEKLVNVDLAEIA